MSQDIAECLLGREELPPVENHWPKLPCLQAFGQTTLHTHLHLSKFHLSSKTHWIRAV